MKFDVIGPRQRRQKLDVVFSQVYEMRQSNTKDYRSHRDQTSIYRILLLRCLSKATEIQGYKSAQ